MGFWGQKEGGGFNNGLYFARGQGKTAARVDENIIKLQAKSGMLERRQKSENISRGNSLHMLFLGNRRKGN